MKEGAKTTNKKTLLVVDDDVEWTDLLRVFFSNAYTVCVANHAEQAIEAILREAPQVIILDLIMTHDGAYGRVALRPAGRSSRMLDDFR